MQGRLRALGVTNVKQTSQAGRQGLSNKEIAGAMFVSPRTVEKHVERLLAKTGLRGLSWLRIRQAWIRDGAARNTGRLPM